MIVRSSRSLSLPFVFSLPFPLCARRVALCALALAFGLGADSCRHVPDPERGELGRLGPTLHRQLGVPGVEPDGDAGGKFSRRVPDQSGIAHRRGADDDAVDPFLEPAFDGGAVTDAAAELDRYGDRLENALDRDYVDRHTVDRRVTAA